MLLGATTKCFGGRTTQEVAELFCKSGLQVAELCLCQSDLDGWKYNFCGKNELPKPSAVRLAADIYASFGIKIAAIGVYASFWEENEATLNDTLDVFTEYCDIACECGIKVLATHGGKVINKSILKSMGGEFAWRMNQAFVYSCIEAEKRGLVISVECGEDDALRDYSDFTALKKVVSNELGRSDMLKFTCVPASDCFKDCLENSALFHIKDRKFGGKFYERFGNGDEDFSDFFEYIRKSQTEIPLILEYVNSENIFQTSQKVLCELSN